MSNPDFPKYEAITTVEEGLEALKQVPGVDPVLAVVDRHPSDIPDQGWLVSAQVAPAACGVINIIRYSSGGLPVTHIRDQRAEHDYASIMLSLENVGTHTVAYEPPEYPYKGREPYDRYSQSTYTGLTFAETDLLTLQDGGRLLDQRIGLQTTLGTSPTLVWRNHLYGGEMSCNRVTEDRGELDQILGKLGFAMGMTTEDVETLITTVSQKFNAATDDTHVTNLKRDSLAPTGEAVTDESEPQSERNSRPGLWRALGNLITRFSIRDGN